MRTLTWLRPMACWVLVATAVPAAANEPASGRPAPRVYTNEDLDLVSARRGQTGVLSAPAVAAPSPPPRSRSGSSEEPTRDTRDVDAGRAQLTASERIWRREAEALRRRLLPLRERLASLRASLEASQDAADSVRRRPARQAARDSAESRVRTLHDRAAALEERIRSEEMMLEDRARRAGALPGWLR